MIRNFCASAVFYGVLTGAYPQALPYADADNASEAVGMMKMTISLSALMEQKCVARFPSLQPDIQAELGHWRSLDRAEIEFTERHWEQMVRKDPKLAARMQEMTNDAYESKLVAPFRKSAPEIERKVVHDYCKQYFRELGTGIWRQRTPRMYRFLAQPTKTVGSPVAYSHGA